MQITAHIRAPDNANIETERINMDVPQRIVNTVEKSSEDHSWNHNGDKFRIGSVDAFMYVAVANCSEKNDQTFLCLILDLCKKFRFRISCK